MSETKDERIAQVRFEQYNEALTMCDKFSAEMKKLKRKTDRLIQAIESGE